MNRASIHQDVAQCDLPPSSEQAPYTTPRLQLLWLFPPLVALAEIVPREFGPQVSLLAHGLLLVLLMIYRALSRYVATHELALALLPVPLIRVLSLALPLNDLPQESWYGLLGLLLLLSAVIIIRQLRLTLREIGLRAGNVLIQAMIAASGLGVGVVAYSLLRPTGAAGSLTLPALWLPMLMIVFSGLAEEVIFRGVLQATARRGLGRGAILYSALIFAVLQLGYQSAEYMAFAFGVGIVFAASVYLSGSILGVALAHGLANITLLVLMPAVTASADNELFLLVIWAASGGVLLTLCAVGVMLWQRRPRRSISRLAGVDRDTHAENQCRESVTELVLHEF